MLTRKRAGITAVAALALIITTGCDSLLTTFRSAFAASRPFVAALVQSGKITQAQADAATTDITDGINDVDKANVCIKAIPASVAGKARKVAKARCYYALAQDLRQILARHNLEADAKLNDVSLIIGGAIEAFETFYNAVQPVSGETSATGITNVGADAAVDNAEQQLENTLKDLGRQFKELKPQ